MKTLLTISFLLLSTLAQSQMHCHCDNDSTIKSYISCDTTILKNHAKLYNLFDCDSMYMILENSKGVKHNIRTLDKRIAWFIRYQPRLINDCDSSILICNSCTGGFVLCSYSLIDKESGQENNIPAFDLIFNDNKRNIIVYFSTIDSLTLHFLNTNKVYNIQIPSERFFNTLQQTSYTEPKDLFDHDLKINNNILILNYRYQDKGVTDKWLYDYITIDLNKYER